MTLISCPPPAASAPEYWMVSLPVFLFVSLLIPLWQIVPAALWFQGQFGGCFRGRFDFVNWAFAIPAFVSGPGCGAAVGQCRFRRISVMDIRCHSTKFVGKPDWVRREVLRLKALMPRRTGYRTIAGLFNRRSAGHANPARRNSVCSSTVRNRVMANLYQITVMRRNLKHHLPPTLPRNVCWGIDLTGKGDTVGDVHAIFGIVDHGSRACLALAAVKDKATISLLRELLKVIEKFGKPKTIRTDNESVFTSHLFRFGLWCLGIKHQRSAVSSPWMNGRVERFFGTLKHSLDQLIVDGCDGLNSALVDFRFFYNHVRPHQHLAGLTPAEVWGGLRWKIKDSAGSNPAAVTNSVAAIAALPPVREEFWFEAWDGLLTGYYLRR